MNYLSLVRCVRKPGAFRALVLAPVVLLLAACYTNPVTGRKSAVAIPVGTELALGAQSFQEIRDKEKVSNDPAANARVRRIGERIAKAVGNDLPDAKWEFVVFESKDLNAFALPGGKVGVYTGILQLAENDAELATVIGHEIGHVTARHGAERMTEAIAINAAGAVGSAIVEAKTEDPRLRQMFEIAYGGATTLGRVLPHSRSNELEADHMGAVYAARAGYDPRAAITFWEKMKAQKQAAEKSGGAGGAMAGWFSTHPSDDKRIADLKAIMPKVVPVYEQNKGKYSQ